MLHLHGLEAVSKGCKPISPNGATIRVGGGCKPKREGDKVVKVWVGLHLMTD